MAVRPTPATLGATVTGVNLARLDARTWQRIEAAFHEHALLIFPGQHLGDAEQAAFARRFGNLEILVEGHESVPLSNQRPDGSLRDDDDHVMQVLRGNEGWHTDSSYMPLAAKASVLSAQVVPESGGETEWADMRAAFDALAPATRERIRDLAAYHSLHHSQAKIGHVAETGTSYGFHDEAPPLRPLVKVHPVTGRPSLFVGRHAYGIPGLPPADSEALLDDLVTFACQPPRTWMHRWRPGDVVVWDNRCVLHRARPYDRREPRVMRHTRVAGDRASELGVTDQQARS
ncbi:MAG: TauD/TfdA dioxygenase family protein [Pseudomonadota bacterium]